MDCWWVRNSCQAKMEEITLYNFLQHLCNEEKVIFRQYEKTYYRIISTTKAISFNDNCFRLKGKSMSQNCVMFAFVYPNICIRRSTAVGDTAHLLFGQNHRRDKVNRYTNYYKLIVFGPLLNLSYFMPLSKCKYCSSVWYEIIAKGWGRQNLNSVQKFSIVIRNRSDSNQLDGPEKSKYWLI